jgi:hypothetical protein
MNSVQVYVIISTQCSHLYKSPSGKEIYLPMHNSHGLNKTSFYFNYHLFVNISIMQSSVQFGNSLDYQFLRTIDIMDPSDAFNQLLVKVLQN